MNNLKRKIGKQARVERTRDASTVVWPIGREGGRDEKRVFKSLEFLSLKKTWNSGIWEFSSPWF